jgi:hypothetical protein
MLAAAGALSSREALGEPSMASSDDGSSTPVPMLGDTVADHPTRRPLPDSTTNVWTPMPRTERSGGRRVMVAAGVAALPLLAIGFMALTGGEEPASSAAPATAAPPASSAEPLPDPSVTIIIDVKPAGARIEIDGVEHEGPRIRLSRAGSHALVVTAPGYQALRRDLSAASDEHLVIELRPLPASERSAVPPPPRSGTRPPADDGKSAQPPPAVPNAKGPMETEL